MNFLANPIFVGEGELHILLLQFDPISAHFSEEARDVSKHPTVHRSALHDTDLSGLKCQYC